MQRCVVILSGHSLFAEGVANRLRQYLEQVEITIVNPLQPDAMAQVAAARPSFVILDVTDSEAIRLYPLSKLLLLLPQLKVIRVNPQQGQVQVVTSEQRPAVVVRDLVEVIEQSI